MADPCLNISGRSWTDSRVCQQHEHGLDRRHLADYIGWGDPTETRRDWCWRCFRRRTFYRTRTQDPAGTGRWAWTYTDGEHARGGPS